MAHKRTLELYFLYPLINKLYMLLCLTTAEWVTNFIETVKTATFKYQNVGVTNVARDTWPHLSYLRFAAPIIFM